jgi:2-keto-4-pentenoate hydratase
MVAARRAGARIALGATDRPRDDAEGFAIQDMVVAALASPVVGWKVRTMPGGAVHFAPILQMGVIANGGTWEVVGREPGGLELEIGFRLGSDIPFDATGEQILAAVATAHVVFELCQSRIDAPDHQTRSVAVADCMFNAGVVIGSAMAHWHREDLGGRSGLLRVNGKVHARGRSADPIGALQRLPAALQARGKQPKAGQIVITGSLTGLTWLTGTCTLDGTIEGLGSVKMTLNGSLAGACGCLL